jgi:RNA polymerase sigma factor (TIGR02999 family)
MGNCDTDQARPPIKVDQQGVRRHTTADIFPVVYHEMRALASRRLRHVKPGHTLQATALVHEVYLRLTESSEPKWDGERHFFAAAARAMREILVDRARSKSRKKRGGDRRRVSLNDQTFDEPIGVDDELMLEVDAALSKLAELDGRRAEIVTLKYFAGLTTPQTARCMEVSERTLEREWQFARVWLYRELTTRMAVSTGASSR